MQARCFFGIILMAAAGSAQATVIRDDISVVDGKANFSQLANEFPNDSVIFDGDMAYMGTYPDTTFATIDSEADNIPTQQLWTAELNQLFGWTEPNGIFGYVAQDFFTLLPLTSGDSVLSAFHYDTRNGGWGSGFVTDEESSDAPEPGSWLLMIGGFGLVGAAMRQRKITVTFA